MTRAITREEILSMPAGRELDELIHLHVLKADYSFEQAFWHGETRWSEDIGKAWEVVEKHDEVAVKRYETSGGHRYWCRITLRDGDLEREIVASGEHAPEAICKAALISLLKED